HRGDHEDRPDNFDRFDWLHYIPWCGIPRTTVTAKIMPAVIQRLSLQAHHPSNPQKQANTAPRAGRAYALIVSVSQTTLSVYKRMGLACSTSIRPVGNLLWYYILPCLAALARRNIVAYLGASLARLTRWWGLGGEPPQYSPFSCSGRARKKKILERLRPSKPPACGPTT
ncbi:MAG TPA: hypothetical protein VKB96_16870, partial [Gammaproteobacteria bacterium]|nr:hypothetical protein [Gammaproteobacteria bacterium]